MKKLLLSISFLFITFSALSQDKSILDSILFGEKAMQVKITEYHMPNAILNSQKGYLGSTINTTIRTHIEKVVSKEIEPMYFYVIKYGDHSTSLKKQELLELKDILSQLKDEVALDASTNPDALQNLYQTKGKVKVGYIIEGNKEPLWILKINPYSEVIKAKDFATLEKVILDGINKIEQVSQ